MSEALYPFAAIGVIAVVTWLLRAVPFLLFSNRPLPDQVKYLGKVLPPAIMTVLIIYCLKDTTFTKYPFGIPELVSVVIVALLQRYKKNMYISIIAGTICYMLLIRLM